MFRFLVFSVLMLLAPAARAADGERSESCVPRAALSAAGAALAAGDRALARATLRRAETQAAACRARLERVRPGGAGATAVARRDPARPAGTPRRDR